jgi:hypothetical protein
MTEVLGDELVSNPATEALAKAMGIPVAKPHGPLLADLAEVDGASVTDVPKPGITGLLVQVYPGQHGIDLTSRKGSRTFAKEGPVWGDPEGDVFPKLPTPKTFENPYLELQAAALGFLQDAIEGRVPKVTWTLAPKPLD